MAEQKLVHLEKWLSKYGLDVTPEDAMQYFDVGRRFLENEIIRPKRVFVAHPIAGDIGGNCESVIKLMSEIFNNVGNTIPVAPYIASLRYLDDTDPEDRKLGIHINKQYFYSRMVDELWLTGDNISEGMEQEIIWAKANCIPVKCYNKELEPLYRAFTETIEDVLDSSC